MDDKGRNTTPSDFGHVCTSVRDVLDTLHALRHVSKVKLQHFAFDITIVAFAIRCGYLFDAFGLRSRQTVLQDVLAEILTKLRNTLPVFKSISLVYDPTSEQHFFVSMPMLSDYYDPQSLLAWVTFIEVRGTATKVCPPPVGLATIFRAVLANHGAQAPPPVVMALPDDDDRSMGDMVAFAACMLEFPVAYVPNSDGPEGGAFLARVPLDVYECVLIPRTGGTVIAQADQEVRTLLKFSCPQAIGMEMPELSPKRVIERLAARFEERVESATSSSWTFVVRHSVQTLDRVAM